MVIARRACAIRWSWLKLAHAPKRPGVVSEQVTQRIVELLMLSCHSRYGKRAQTGGSISAGGKPGTVIWAKVRDGQYSAIFAAWRIIPANCHCWLWMRLSWSDVSARVLRSVCECMSDAFELLKSNRVGYSARSALGRRQHVIRSGERGSHADSVG